MTAQATVPEKEKKRSEGMVLRDTHANLGFLMMWANQIETDLRALKI